MNRRSFLSMITGAVAAALLPRPQTDPGTYSYRYIYRNSVTGCCSDASATVPPQHTFMMPENDVIDVYRIQDDGQFEWIATAL